MFSVHARQNLALSLMLAISMVGVSYGAGGVLPGDGLSESTAYLIEDLADFDVFADPCNSATYWSSGVHTKLTCDPSLTGRTYTTAVIAPDTDNTNSDFEGIPFRGIFDGNNYIIENRQSIPQGQVMIILACSATLKVPVPRSKTSASKTSISPAGIIHAFSVACADATMTAQSPIAMPPAL